VPKGESESQAERKGRHGDDLNRYDIGKQDEIQAQKNKVKGKPKNGPTPGTGSDNFHRAVLAYPRHQSGSESCSYQNCTKIAFVHLWQF